jgi:hypothetical protein
LKDQVFADEHGFSESYLLKMSAPGEWGDGIILAMSAYLFNRPIIVLSNDNPPLSFCAPDSPLNAEPLLLGYIGISGASEKDHYIPLRRNSGNRVRLHQYSLTSLSFI